MLFDNFDEQYWLDSEAEECNVREKAQRIGIDNNKINELICKHPDAFEITDRDLEELLEE